MHGILNNGMVVDDFIQQRQRIDQGLQIEFLEILKTDLRGITNPNYIFMGRLIILLTLTNSALGNNVGLEFNGDQSLDKAQRL